MPSRALLAALLFTAPLAAQEPLFQQQPDPKSNTRVEAVAHFSSPAPGGFLPVRVTVTNAGEQDGCIALRCTATDGIITLDENGHIRGFSAGAEALFGYRLADVAGRPFADLLAPESRKVVRNVSI